MKDDNGDNLRIGYGNPPKHSQFKKGQSGNPGGRPKGEQSLKAAIEEALEEFVTLEVAGERQRLKLREVLARNLVTKAAKGDVQAITLIDKMQSRSVPAAASAPAHPEFPIKFTLKLEDDDPEDLKE